MSRKIWAAYGTWVSLLVVLVVVSAVYSQGVVNQGDLTTPDRTVGEIVLLGHGQVPIGWLRCTGSWQKVSNFPALYDVIGGKWGRRTRNGEREFRLPKYYVSVDNKVVWGIINYGGTPAQPYRFPIK